MHLLTCTLNISHLFLCMGVTAVLPDALFKKPEPGVKRRSEVGYFHVLSKP